MDNLTKPDLEHISREMATAFEGIVSWKWDDRFNTVVAAFSAEEAERVRAILEQYLTATWDSKSVDMMPEIVQAVGNQLDGLMAGQLLFTSDPEHEALVFCAWWPWGNGKTISIRLAPFDHRLSDAQRDEHIQKFKGWFGV